METHYSDPVSIERLHMGVFSVKPTMGILVRSGPVDTQ